MQTEFWLSGPQPGIPTLLQPVAHAILQSEAEINDALNNFPDTALWERPSGVASVAFHLQHIAGVQDRLFSYALGATLSSDQFEYLKKEGTPDDNITVGKLLQHLHHQTEKSIQQLKNTDEKSLTEVRYVGRKKIATTLMGILFHAAEHTMRHTGQLLVTAKIINPISNEDNIH
ncbi:MAG: DinB family protein [Bacteroidetes bacterium]|nr:DinB family protein [Bacteroidota bacterium]